MQKTAIRRRQHFFQKAAIAAIEDVFGPTGAVVQGCYFHFTQAIWRKIRSVRYLANTVRYIRFF